MAKERYENGKTYIEYEITDGGTVYYSYGVVGFGENGRGVLSPDNHRRAKQNLLNDGYWQVESAPLSEEGGRDGGVLLDWMGGITR